MRKFEIMIFESKELERIVRVYIKLPDNYYSTNETYPVLYLHDGQVGFNDFENGQLDWGLLEDYIHDQSTEVILVGIGSGDTRIDELCPYELLDREKVTRGGKTDLYLDFIINQLKPMIDKTYRTKSEPQYTGMMGISLGGLCTVYALTKHSDIFTRFAFISGGFIQFTQKLIDEINNADLSKIKKVYSDVGTNEHENEVVRNRYITTNQEIYDVLTDKLERNVYHFHIIEDSKHEFPDWNKRVPSIIEFMFQ